MVSVLLDSQMQSKLQQTGDPVNLVDENGATIRVAVTPEQYQRILGKSMKVPISDAELARYAEEPGTGSLQDFWKQIGAK